MITRKQQLKTNELKLFLKKFMVKPTHFITKFWNEAICGNQDLEIIYLLIMQEYSRLTCWCLNWRGPNWGNKCISWMKNAEVSVLTKTIPLKHEAIILGCKSAANEGIRPYKKHAMHSAAMIGPLCKKLIQMQ
jgi:hypothetical protein